MFECFNCKKIFKYNSEFIRHKNRKLACNQPKKEYKCNVCNVKFISPAQQQIHENTKKHLYNTNNQDEFIGVDIDANKNTADLIDYNNKIQTLESIITNLNNQVNELNNNVVNNLNNKIKNLDNVNLNLNNKITNLNNEIKHLNIENQNLKNNQSLHAGYESIYIIHAGQHVNTNIYKIGRTCNINARRIQYPDGSKLLYSFCCKNSKTVENLILDYLKLDKQTFKLMDFGREYFQCNLKDLRNAVLQFVD